MKKTSLLSLCFILSIALQAQGLKDYLPAGKYIGTAVNNQYLQGGNNVNGYNDTLISDFNCIVAENAYKMAYIIPNRPADPFNLTIDDLSASQLLLVDAMIDTANNNNMKTRGHAFIWHSQAPSWLTTDAQSWTNQQIYDFAESYITVFGTYCKGRIDEWDVVNEALNDNGNGFRTGTWYDNVDDKQDFIEHCFTVAHAADPDADLFYNDYSIELYKFSQGAVGNVKNGPMLQMVNTMLDHGTPINGVGLQSHYISGSDMTDSTYITLEKTIDSLNTLGLFCNMTEMDIRICGGTTEADLDKQKDEYRRITEIFLENDNCNSMLVWGITDASSWIPGVFSGCDDPLLYDAQMQPKPAYYGVLQSLMIESGMLSGPYNFEPQVIPGKIEMEDYDYDAFYDNDSGNTGGVYREDSVDITTGNTGYVVGWTEAGEYLTYTVNVTVADTFELAFVYASDIVVGNYSEIELLIDNVALDENVMLPSTGSYSVFDTIAIDSLILEKGKHKIRLNIVSDSANIDYIEFSRADCNGVRNGSAYIDDCDVCVGGDTGLDPCIIRNPYTVMTIPGIIEAENYDEGKNGVTYYDATSGNQGGEYRTDDVDLGTTDDNGGGYVLGWIEPDEWLEYTITIEETADYTVTFRVASGLTTGNFDLSVDGETVISNLAVPNTGGWTTYDDLVFNDIPLEAGEAVIRIDVSGGYFNMNYMQFEIIDEETGIHAIYGDKLLITPNPFTDELQVEGLQINQAWKIYSIDGKLQKKGMSDRIITNDLKPGIYIFKTNDQVIKLIKTK